MKSRVAIILTLLLFFISSCKGKKVFSDAININLYKDSLICVNLSEYKYSILNSPQVIGAIDRVCFSDNSDVLLKTGKLLFLYSQEGKYITSISRLGRASNEYLSILDFGFKGDFVYLYDMNGKKMMFFDKNGKHLYNYLLPEGIEVKPFQLIIPIGNHYIGKRMYCGFPSFPELSLYDSNFKYIKTINGSNMHLCSGIYLSSQFASYSDESVLYNRLFDTKIYEVKCDTAIVRFNVVFDEKTIDIDAYKDEYEILKEINKKKCAYSTLIDNIEYDCGKLTFSYAYTKDKNGYRIASYDCDSKRSNHYSFNIDEQIAYACAYKGTMYVFTQTEEGRTKLYYVPFPEVANHVCL